jgi:hypothetical protein
MRTGVHTVPPLAIQTHRSVEKGHGQLEERQIRVSSELEGYSSWPYLTQAFEYRCTWTIQLVALKRGHWQIGNGLHYVKDVMLARKPVRPAMALARMCSP